MHHGTIPPSASLVHKAVLHSFRDDKKKKKKERKEREKMHRASRHLPRARASGEDAEAA